MGLSKKAAEEIASDINSIVVATEMLSEKSIEHYLKSPDAALKREEYVRLWLGHRSQAAARIKANGVPVKYL